MKSKMSNIKYANLNISLKLLISTGFLILLSVFLVSYLSYLQYTEDFKLDTADKVQQTIEQVSLNIETYLDDLFRLAVSPYYDAKVIEALSSDAAVSEMEQLNKTRTIENFLNQMMIIPRKDILRVYILTDRIYSSRYLLQSINSDIDFKQFEWYKKALETREPVFVPAHKEVIVNSPKHVVFSVVKQLRSIKDTTKVIGVIKVDANYSGIEAICSKVKLGAKGGLFIIDDMGNLIYSDNHTIPYDVFYKEIQASGKQFITVKTNNMSYLVNQKSIPRSNWTIIAVSSLNEIYKEAKNTRDNAFLLAILCSGLAILVLSIFIKWFLKPLLKVVKLMKQVQEGNLSVRFPDKREDEVGYLGKSFNGMIEKINQMLTENTSLVKEVYEAKYLQKEAQLNALSKQIKPHFIYNTLNMISLLIQGNYQEKAVDNINKLSKLLRSMANWDRDIKLQQELELLNAYLGIQNCRFEGRLEYCITVDEEFYTYNVPALILQPIAENAVVHGCETKRDKTLINVYSKREDDKLVLIVEDTGAGMSEEKLHSLRCKLEEANDYYLYEKADGKEHKSIGLINVDRRIKIKFGKQYGLRIASSLGVGTTVEIVLPIKDIT